MISLPDDLPDDPVLLKQMLVQMLSERQVDKDQIVDLKEQIKLWRQRFFGRKSEQTVDPQTPQLALFNEPESLAVPVCDESDEEAVARPSAVASASRCRLTCRASKSSTNFQSTN